MEVAFPLRSVDLGLTVLLLLTVFLGVTVLLFVTVFLGVTDLVREDLTAVLFVRAFAGAVLRCVALLVRCAFTADDRLTVLFFGCTCLVFVRTPLVLSVVLFCVLRVTVLLPLFPSTAVRAVRFTALLPLFTVVAFLLDRGVARVLAVVALLLLLFRTVVAYLLEST